MDNAKSQIAADSIYRTTLVLKENPLLDELSDEEYEYLARAMSLRVIPKGSVVFSIGDQGDYMLFIVQGKMEISLDTGMHHRVIAVCSTGAVVGEMAIIDEYPRSATVVTQEDTEVLIMTKSRFEQVIQDKPHLGLKLYRGLARVVTNRLRNTMGRFSELA